MTEFTAHTPAFADHPAVRELWRVYGEAVTAEFSIDGLAHRRSNFTEKLLDSPAFARALPMLAPPRLAAPAFVSLSAFQLAGSFAEALHRGGAYSRTEDAIYAEELGRSLVHALLGDRREQVVVLAAEDGWHVWFANVAWDRTWIALDWSERRIHFVAATSTD